MIDSASKLAKIFSIPPFIVGLTVIAFGTSTPELVIGIFSGIGKHNLITLGDVIGSCIANIALIIGVTAIIRPLSINSSVLYKEIPISFFAQALLWVMLAIGGVLSRIDSILLLFFFAAFLYYTLNRSKTSELSQADDTQPSSKKNEDSKLKLAVMLAISIGGVILGGSLIVNSSTDIAQIFGLSDVLIGATIVALGTSLPELITSITAALKKESDLAIGNIIGSNIFNILFVLGVSALINPIPQTEGIYVDIAFMLLATVSAFVIPLKSKAISRPGGISLFILYALFMVYKLISG